jgi:hypothetical protein
MLKAQCHHPQRGNKRGRRNCTGWGSCAETNRSLSTAASRNKYGSDVPAPHATRRAPTLEKRSAKGCRGANRQGCLRGKHRSSGAASAYALAPWTPAMLGGDCFSGSAPSGGKILLRKGEHTSHGRCAGGTSSPAHTCVCRACRASTMGPRSAPTAGHASVAQGVQELWASCPAIPMPGNRGAYWQ